MLEIMSTRDFLCELKLPAVVISVVTIVWCTAVRSSEEEARVYYEAEEPVARMNACWLVTRPPGLRPTLQRLWGTVWLDGEAAYLALFMNDRGLLLPLSR